jgi:peptide chain release factor 1
LKVEILDSSESHVTAKISGPDAGSHFRFESGKHCIQRIPDNDPKGRKQTSIVTVGVLPIKPEDEGEPLRDQDLEITTTKGKVKAGGQHQNKAETACRIVHLPTGITVFICNERSQHANKEIALKIITARVNDFLRSQKDAEYAALRKAMMGDGGRSGKIRTYNMLESRITDHRLGKKTCNIKGFMNGNFDVLFK